MELLVMAIPGSYNTEWGRGVWKRVSKAIEDEDENRSWSELAVRLPTDVNFPLEMSLIVQPHQ